MIRRKALVSSLALLLVFGLVVSGCGGSFFKGDDPAGSVSGVEVSAEQMEREFRDLVKGTIEAAETDPKSLRYSNETDFSYDRFAVSDPAGYCGKVEGGDYEGQYRINLGSKRVDEHYSVEQYEAKVVAVRRYWRSLGMDPKNAPTGDNAWKIVARTPLGGEVSYMASLYGESMVFKSACSEKIKFGQNRR